MDGYLIRNIQSHLAPLVENWRGDIAEHRNSKVKNYKSFFGVSCLRDIQGVTTEEAVGSEKGVLCSKCVLIIHISELYNINNLYHINTLIPKYESVSLCETMH